MAQGKFAIAHFYLLRFCDQIDNTESATKFLPIQDQIQKAPPGSGHATADRSQLQSRSNGPPFDINERGNAMPNAEMERRKTAKELSSVLKRELNARQLETLQGLEQFGWELKFIRRKPFQPSVAVVFDGDRKQFVVLELDGSLIEPVRRK